MLKSNMARFGNKNALGMKHTEAFKQQLSLRSIGNKYASRLKMSDIERKKRRAVYMRKYRKEKPEIIKACEKRRIRPEGFREKFNRYCKKWHKDNPDSRLASYQKRRSFCRCYISPKELITLRESQKGLCFYCHNPLGNKGRGHLEHKTPLSRGGKHEIKNIAFACAACNLKKATKTAEEFICCVAQ